MGGKWNSVNKSWDLPLDAEPWCLTTLKAVAAGETKGANTTSLDADDFTRLETYVDKAIDAKAKELQPDMAEAMADDLTALANAVKSGVYDEVIKQTRTLRDRLDAAEKRAEEARILVIKTEYGEHEVEGRPHPLFEELVTALGAGLHAWVAGPAGSGKSYAAKQAAKALGVSFEVQGAMTMAHELTGFVDAGGRYHETPFVRAMRDGGLILLDEIDAGSNEALLALNGALANGMMSLPNGEVIEAHDNFKCIGAANTFGNGATAEYVGRVRLDAAFLDRFGARFDWGYDETLERDISGNADWARQVQTARKLAAKKGLKVMITPRQSQAGARLLAAGMDAGRVAELTYLAGLTPDQRKLVAPAAKTRKIDVNEVSTATDASGSY